VQLAARPVVQLVVQLEALEEEPLEAGALREGKANYIEQ
jgi:hypothetical protein